MIIKATNYFKNACIATYLIITLSTIIYAVINQGLTNVIYESLHSFVQQNHDIIGTIGIILLSLGTLLVVSIKIKNNITIMAAIDEFNKTSLGNIIIGVSLLLLTLLFFKDQ